MFSIKRIFFQRCLIREKRGILFKIISEIRLSSTFLIFDHSIDHIDALYMEFNITKGEKENSKERRI